MHATTHNYFKNLQVKTAKPFVDSKAPASHAYIHMHLRLKRKEFERQKKEIIQKNNRKLLENMTFIMQTTCRVDHKNNFYRRRRFIYFIVVPNTFGLLFVV